MVDDNRSDHRISVIGMGNMGTALAERLLDAGHSVAVWNRTNSKCAPLGKRGAEVISTVIEAVRSADSILICVLDDDAVQEILSTVGLAPALDGKSVVQLTSLEAEESKAQQEWMHGQGARYLDGGILGFPADVREARVRIAYSGSRAVFDESKSWLNAFGPEAIFIGEQPGTAPLASMLTYAQYYGITYTCMHTMALAAAAGITARSFLELSGGPEAWRQMGRVMDEYVAMTDTGDYATSEATLEIDAADYDYFLRLCDEFGIDASLHRTIKASIEAAISQGRKDEAIPAIFESISCHSKP